MLFERNIAITASAADELLKRYLQNRYKDYIKEYGKDDKSFLNFWDSFCELGSTINLFTYNIESDNIKEVDLEDGLWGENELAEVQWELEKECFDYLREMAKEFFDEKIKEGK